MTNDLKYCNLSFSALSKQLIKLKKYYRVVNLIHS